MTVYRSASADAFRKVAGSNGFVIAGVVVVTLPRDGFFDLTDIAGLYLVFVDWDRKHVPRHRMLEEVMRPAHSRENPTCILKQTTNLPKRNRRRHDTLRG